MEDRFIQKDKLVHLAKLATSKAIANARKKNISITYTVGLTIVRELKGKKIAIGRIEPGTRRYKKGDRIFLQEK